MEDYYRDIANRTKMGDYLTQNERTFIDSFLESNNISTCLDVACGSGRFSIPTFDRYSFDDVVRHLNEAGFEVKKRTGYNWLPFKRNSNNSLIGIFEFLKKALGLGSLASVSPRVLFVALKREER